MDICQICNYMVDTFSTMVEHLDWYVVSQTGSEYWQWFLITPHLSTHSFSAKHSEEYFWLVLTYWQVNDATAPPPYLWAETLVNVSVTIRVTDQVNIQLCSMEKLRWSPISYQQASRALTKCKMSVQPCWRIMHDCGQQKINFMGPQNTKVAVFNCISSHLGPARVCFGLWFICK